MYVIVSYQRYLISYAFHTMLRPIFNIFTNVRLLSSCGTSCILLTDSFLFSSISRVSLFPGSFVRSLSVVRMRRRTVLDRAGRTTTAWHRMENKTALKK